MHHSTHIKVRGYHLDLYGHVNNARYLEFLEEARWQLIEEQHDLSWFMARRLAFVVVNININYRRGAVLHDELSISTGLKSLSTRSAVLHQAIHLRDTDTLVADADVTFVLVDGQTQRAVPLEGEVRTHLEGAWGQQT